MDRQKGGQIYRNINGQVYNGKMIGWIEQMDGWMDDTEVLPMYQPDNTGHTKV